MTPDPLLGRAIGNYRIAALIGAGGMGRVYRADQPAIGARVAIKVMTMAGEGAVAERIDRFFAEARAVNLIRHESIVNILDLGRLDDGTPFIVMEHLDGASLRDHLTARGPLPVAEVVDVAVQVLSALTAAHARGIVHRDLKPDNVFVTSGGRAKVLDFGLAKLLAEADLSRGFKTGSSAMLGTPPYLAPEQLLGGAVDARTDLWALGVTLYEVLTGRRPFDARQMFDLFRDITESAAPPVASLRADIPATVDAALMRALAKAPADRFADAAQMAAALQMGQPPRVITVPPRPISLRPQPAEPARAIPEPPATVALRVRRPEVEEAPRRKLRALWLAVLLLLCGALAVAVWPRSRKAKAALGPDGGVTRAALPVDAGAIAERAPVPVAPPPVSPPGKHHGRRDAGVPVATPVKPVATVIARPTPVASPDAKPDPTPEPEPTPEPTPTPVPPPPSESPWEKVIKSSDSLDTWGPPQRFDVTTRMTEARAIARRYLPDAVLIEIYTWTNVDGITDLADRGVDYSFFSPAQAGRADHHCWLKLAISTGAITVSAYDTDTCKRPSGPPRCSAANARTRATAQGLGITTASQKYHAGHWTISNIADGNYVDVPDDC